MDILQRSLLEKAGNDNGFEYVLPPAADAVELGSARHKARVRIRIVEAPNTFGVQIVAGSAALGAELARSFPDLPRAALDFTVTGMGLLARVLRRMRALAQALPNQAEQDFSAEVQKALSDLPADLGKHTEVLAMVRRRVGQQALRAAMLDYWGGACAVTGIALPEVLRASHAKPWADCTSDAERLNVFNGLLLSANLDALFDRFLISFDDAGQLLVSDRITAADRESLGLAQYTGLRWIAVEHMPFLAYHRNRMSEGGEAGLTETSAV
jgi:putative restriction endonuclease